MKAFLLNDGKMLNLWIKILCVLAVFAALGLVRMILNISKYYKQKKLIETKYSNLYHTGKPAEAYDTMIGRIESSNKLMDLIANMVENEVNITLFSYRFIGQQFPVARVDAEIKRISEKIYKGIKSEILVSINISLEPEYVMSLITDATTVSLMTNVRKYNTELKLDKAKLTGQEIE